VNLTIARIIKPLSTRAKANEESERAQWVRVIREHGPKTLGTVVFKDLELVEHTNDQLDGAEVKKEYTLGTGVREATRLPSQPSSKGERIFSDNARLSTSIASDFKSQRDRQLLLVSLIAGKHFTESQLEAAQIIAVESEDPDTRYQVSIERDIDRGGYIFNFHDENLGITNTLHVTQEEFFQIRNKASAFSKSGIAEELGIGFSGVSATGLNTLRLGSDEAVTKVLRFFDVLYDGQLPTQQRTVTIGLNWLPRDEVAFRRWLNFLQIILDEIKDMDVARNIITFRLEIDDPKRRAIIQAHPLSKLLDQETPRGQKEIRLALEELFNDGSANIPISRIEKGQFLYLKAIVLFLVLAGPLQGKTIGTSDGITRLYKSLLPRNVAVSLTALSRALTAFLSGHTSEALAALSEFPELSLGPLPEEIPWDIIIRFFDLAERMHLQAA